MLGMNEEIYSDTYRFHRYSKNKAIYIINNFMPINSTTQMK